MPIKEFIDGHVQCAPIIITDLKLELSNLRNTFDSWRSLEITNVMLHLCNQRLLFAKYKVYMVFSKSKSAMERLNKHKSNTNNPMFPNYTLIAPSRRNRGFSHLQYC